MRLEPQEIRITHYVAYFIALSKAVSAQSLSHSRSLSHNTRIQPLRNQHACSDELPIGHDVRAYVCWFRYFVFQLLPSASCLASLHHRKKPDEADLSIH